ncbi:MAG: nifS [Rickettsiaceae bacterium]|nr:nifS [Rickettsiaceae bacterium]
MSHIYLDHNATVSIEPEVQSAMLEVMGLPFNPSSTHSFGRKAHGIIETSRNKVATLAGATDCRVIFTASGTEANNLAVKGVTGYRPMVSAIEHISVLKPAKDNGCIVVPVTNDGNINIEALDKLLAMEKSKCVVSIMLANNETGIIQPIKKVVEIAHRYGAIVHTDAAQCFGKIPVNMNDLGVDMLSISAHKFGGPQGAAALIAKKNVPLHAEITGGGQELGFRAGTQNVAAIYGFGMSAELVYNNISSDIEYLRNQLETEIKAFAPEVVVFGHNQNRLPNTSYLTMSNVQAETQLIHFDINGIAVSAGSACSSGKIETSHVLKAMGVTDSIAKTTIRVSLGKNNTKNDIEAFILAWKQLYTKINEERSAA